MLIKEYHQDLAHSKGPMRTYFYQPNFPEYPNARFPGVVVFSEIYQVTGPIHRLCRAIAGNGYLVTCPESYHEFEEPGVALQYNDADTTKGNRYKIEKELASYDEDSRLAIDTLVAHPNCNGRIGTTGVCLGGHLAFRCALDPRVRAAVCYYGTDIHSATLGKGKSDDSLKRSAEIKGEITMIFGKQDTHVPRAGRDLIKKTLEDCNVTLNWVELQAQHAFNRDELSKGRYDSALSRVLFELMLELFDRRLKLDLGTKAGEAGEIEHYC
jgi:carboxymethylenebutenolidase